MIEQKKKEQAEMMEKARLASQKVEQEPEEQEEEDEEEEESGQPALAKVKTENVAKIEVEDDFDIDDI